VTRLSLAFLENTEVMQFSPASLVLFTTTTKSILNKTGNIRIMLTLTTCSCTHRCRRKAISITYSDRVFAASVTQYSKRMRRTILLSGTCPTVTHFSTLSHKQQDFGGESYGT
jgi:hypothetical protein